MKIKAKLLYVEDDVTLSYVTRDNLELCGYETDFCGDGETALEMFRQHQYDLCIFDIMLPKMDGYDLAAKIRKFNQDIPIIFLTARSAREDRLHGLRIGADDYITKPFSIEELALKIKVFLKRSGRQNSHHADQYKIGSYVFDVDNYCLIRGEDTRQLTKREADLLKLFCEHTDHVLKRDDILMKVWGSDHYFVSRSMDVFISRLRKYLKGDPNVVIENIHNIGYRLIVKR